jgi:hypothetical protein
MPPADRSIGNPLFCRQPSVRANRHLSPGEHRDPTTKSQIEPAMEPSRDMSQIWDIAVIRAIAILHIGNMLSSGYNAAHEKQNDSILMSYKVPLVDAAGHVGSNATDGNL